MSDDRSLAADEAALAAAAAELDEVQAVLGRLDDGTFDRCGVCGAPIGVERLKADPLTTRCAQHGSAEGAHHAPQDAAQQDAEPARPPGEF
jgi:DnaK suppressor protein